MDRTDPNCIFWWSSNEPPLSPQAVFKGKSHTNNFRLPTVKLILSEVPKSSHWEPSICGAGSLYSAKVLQKVPRDLKSSPKSSRELFLGVSQKLSELLFSVEKQRIRRKPRPWFKRILRRYKVRFEVSEHCLCPVSSSLEWNQDGKTANNHARKNHKSELPLF